MKNNYLRSYNGKMRVLPLVRYKLLRTITHKSLYLQRNQRMRAYAYSVDHYTAAHLYLKITLPASTSHKKQPQRHFSLPTPPFRG
jgi:hypothetical protein